MATIVGVGARVVAGVLIVIGVLALAAGIVYLLVPSESLPSFVPGHLAGVTAKHTTRGAAGLLLGFVLVVIGVVVGRRRRSPYPS
jgi:uncharacterized membrane protein